MEDAQKELIRNCFVTGKWKASEDAENLLRLDDMSDADSEVYGDFEDLETGEKFEGKTQNPTEVENEEKPTSEQSTDNLKRKMTRVEEENLTKADLMAKKLKLKAKFDAEYDNTGEKEDNGRITGDHDFYEGLKADAKKQSELNKSEFANLDADLRVQIEGFRAGLYVRLGGFKLFIYLLNINYNIL